MVFRGRRVKGVIGGLLCWLMIEIWMEVQMNEGYSCDGCGDADDKTLYSYLYTRYFVFCILYFVPVTQIVIDGKKKRGARGLIKRYIPFVPVDCQQLAKSVHLSGKRFSVVFPST